MKVLRILLPLLLWFAWAPAAHALRCDGYIIHQGDFDYQVRDRCGDPFWSEGRVKYEGYGTERDQVLHAVQYTTLYYNFGSNQFMVRLLFRDGHLRAEERLGRGVDEIGSACDTSRLPRGLTGGELVAYCGAPTQRYVQPSLTSHIDPAVPVPPGVGGMQNQLSGPYRIEQDEDYREEWLYDFGEDQLFVAYMVNGNVNGFERRPR